MCRLAKRQRDEGRLAREQFEEGEHAAVPLLIAPAFAHGTAQAVPLFWVVQWIARSVANDGREQHAGFQLEMREGPECRQATDAKLPDVTFCDIAQHGGALLALPPPRNLLSNLGHILGGME